MTYRCNTGTARLHSTQFQPVAQLVFNRLLAPGSFNLWSARSLKLPEPVEMFGVWHMWPVIVADRIPGLFARTAQSPNPKFVEVYSPVLIAEALGVVPEAPVSICVLPGSLINLVERRVTGFRQDEQDHWIAELACGHGQHVRHEPPLASRPWVLTEAGRACRIGTSLLCQRCAEGSANEQAAPDV